MSRPLALSLALALLTVAAAQTFDVVAPSEARYRVRERVLGIWLPATVGSTSAVSGLVTFDGPVVVAPSRIEVEAARITSDQLARDIVVRRESLQTDRYPLVVFVPLQIVGLPWPLPREGSIEVDVLGELRVRDVARRVSWIGTARFEGDVVRLEASTTVTFEEIELPRPGLFALAILDDVITLEVALTLARR
jgi:polyisoprenoid-binding protein YceI